jgi:tetratricopeptide (TPR) repeat protein
MGKRHASALVAILTISLSLCCLLRVEAATNKLQDRKKIADLMHAQDLFIKGLEQQKTGHSVMAEKMFKQVLSILPEHSEAAFCLGLYSYKAKDYEAALKYFESAKDNFFTWQALILDNQLEEKGAALEISTYIFLIERYPNPGEDAMGMSEFRERMRYGEDLMRMNPPSGQPTTIPAEYYFYAGNCLMKLQRYFEAFDEYNKVIEINPEYGDAYGNLALLYFMTQDYVDSWLSLQMAKKYGAEINPEFEKTLISKMQN